MKPADRLHMYRRHQQVLSSTQPVILALLTVALVVGLSLSLAHWFSLSSHFDALAGWGAWIGAFVSGLALLGTAYAVVTQVRQSETASWSIALSRLGDLYDLTLSNSDLAQMLAEDSCPDEDRQPLYPPDSLRPEQRVWLGSLFLAYEQIYVATLSLSHESRRVWRIYIANQLNKPSLRAQFCRDAVASKDYHQAFWRFVRGRSRGHGYTDFAIAPIFFEKPEYSSTNRGEPTLELRSGQLTAKPFNESEYGFWMRLYRDPDVKRQMYAAPLESLEEFKAFLRKRTLFTVYNDDLPIGGFSITRESQFMATFGFMLVREQRGKHHGEHIMNMLEEQAAFMGYKTLRADIYEDNLPSIKSLAKQGFRRFIWMEKNLLEPPTVAYDSNSGALVDLAPIEKIIDEVSHQLTGETPVES